jgi:hypothetical protein
VDLKEIIYRWVVKKDVQNVIPIIQKRMENTEEFSVISA